MVADQVFGGLYGAIVVEDPDELPVSPRAGPGRLRHHPGRRGARAAALDDGPDDGPRRGAGPGQRAGAADVHGPPRRAGAVADRERLRRSLRPATAGRPATGPAGHRLRSLRRATPRRGDRAGHRQPGRPARHRDRGHEHPRGAGRRPRRHVRHGRPEGWLGLRRRRSAGHAPGDRGCRARAARRPRHAAAPATCVPPSSRRAGGWSSAWAVGGGMGRGGPTFTIDGAQFDPDRVDQTVALGTVEEWTIVNPTPMDHPFHLHVWPMQIVAEAGRAGGRRPPAGRRQRARPERGHRPDRLRGVRAGAPCTTATSSITRTTG